MVARTLALQELRTCSLVYGVYSMPVLVMYL